MTEGVAFPALSAYLKLDPEGFDPPPPPPGRWWEKHSEGKTAFSSVSSSSQCLSQDSRGAKWSVVKVHQEKREGNCLHCSATIPVLHYIYPLDSNPYSPSTWEQMWLFYLEDTYKDNTSRTSYDYERKRGVQFPPFISVWLLYVRHNRESTALLFSCNHTHTKRTEWICRWKVAW